MGIHTLAVRMPQKVVKIANGFGVYSSSNCCIDGTKVRGWKRQ
jgi:hypothetical protein